MIENQNFGKLPDEAYNKLGPLLSLFLVLKKFTGSEMILYLEDKYKFNISLKNNSLDAKGAFIMEVARGARNLAKTKVDIDIWSKIIDDFEKELIPTVKKFVYQDEYEKTFYAKRKFNWASVYSLIDNISNANSIIYFNTFIGTEEWFDPIVQMHMGIQKSIEQKMNYAKVQDCHANFNPSERKKNNFIDACNANPPVYRQYRVLFYPKSREEFKKLIKTENKEYDSLAYVAFLHTSLSIQLAIFTLDDWMEIIQTNKSFFKAIENLRALKLVSDETDQFDITTLNMTALGNHIINCLSSQNNMPFEETYEGIDFLLANTKVWSTDQKAIDVDGSFYSTYYDKENPELKGVNYFPLVENDITKIKLIFTNIVLNHISEPGFASKTHDHKKLDPIHSFYINANESFWKFTGRHDASLTLNLEK